jgi:hypothetical protein
MHTGHYLWDFDCLTCDRALKKFGSFWQQLFAANAHDDVIDALKYAVESFDIVADKLEDRMRTERDDWEMKGYQR